MKTQDTERAIAFLDELAELLLKHHVVFSVHSDGELHIELPSGVNVSLEHITEDCSWPNYTGYIEVTDTISRLQEQEERSKILNPLTNIFEDL